MAELCSCAPLLDLVQSACVRSLAAGTRRVPRRDDLWSPDGATPDGPSGDDEAILNTAGVA
jgi:hypothetical protein